jgi:hypothetical protein
MLPTPSQIIASFERGEIEREEMHAMMSLHARELIREMDEDYQNPAAAWIEGLRARRAMGHLVRRHGGRLIREILVALADLPDFPTVRHLWNAAHPDVPLHCFLRIRREPVFRIPTMEIRSGEVLLTLEHGAAGKGKATRTQILLRRNDFWKLKAELV